jgi:uncharacterized RDD family membrane protein YckC
VDQQPPAAPPPDDLPAAAPPPAAPVPAPPAPAAPAPAAPTPVPAAAEVAPPFWQSAPMSTGPAPGVEWAGYGARIVAYILDWLIIGLVIGILWVIIGLVWQDDGSGLLTTTLVGATILIWLLYFPYFWHRNGTTPGMTPFGIRVVRDRDGGPIGWGSAFLRLIGYTINSIVFGIPLGFLWVFFDKRRRGWHDLIGGTVVIKG